MRLQGVEHLLEILLVAGAKTALRSCTWLDLLSTQLTQITSASLGAALTLPESESVEEPELAVEDLAGSLRLLPFEAMLQVAQPACPIS